MQQSLHPPPPTSSSASSSTRGRGRRWRRLLAVTAAVAVAAVAAAVIVALVALHEPRPPVLRLSAGERLGNDRRTLIVGVDGLSWRRVLPLAAEGRLPHLAELMEEGTYGVLHSHRTLRPSNGRWGYWSPVVWTSLATGVRVEKHGISDFGFPDAEGRLRLAKTWHRRAPAFWNLFSAFGLPVGVVGWWGTWPAEEVEGVMASSSLGLRGHRGIRRLAIDDGRWFGKRRRLTHPAGLTEVILRDIGLPAHGGETLRELFGAGGTPGWLAEEEIETLEAVLWQDELYHRIALHLLQRHDFAVTTVYLEAPDVFSHHFWRHVDSLSAPAGAAPPPAAGEYRQVVDRVYQIADRRLGELLAAAGAGVTVFVVSDHGFTAVAGHPQGADHEGRGVLIARGEGIRRGRRLNLSVAGALREALVGRTRVFDFLPTLLYLHALPVAEDLDGRVLHRMLEPSYLAANPQLTVPTYGDFAATRRVEVPLAGDASQEEDEAEYFERLKALGYLE